MKKIVMFFKNKLFWTLILLVSLVSIFASVLIIKGKNPYKPAFFNYISYISPANRQEIEKTFTYKEYGTVIEFKNALEKEQAAAGIITASEAARLVKDDRIRPIDFNKVYKLEGDKALKNEEDTKNFLKNVLTKKTWEQLESYDKYLTNIKTKQGQVEDRHLWNYFVPYYAQDYVIAYSTHKNDGILLEDVKDYELSWFEILSKLNELGYNNIGIINDLRNNAAVGTSRLHSKNNEDHFLEKDGNITQEDYDDQIVSFQKIVEDSLHIKISDPNRVLFEPDGSSLLDKLIVKESNINVGILFNGDALDAFFSEDNNKDVPEGSVRIIKPKESIVTLDGVVINSSVSDEEAELFYNSFNKTFYDYAKFINTEDYADYSNLEAFLEERKKKEINEDGVEEEEVDYELVNFLSNFDFINYTPVYKIEYNYLLDNYFDGELGELSSNIYKIEGPKSIFLKPITKQLDAQTRIKFNSIVSN